MVFLSPISLVHFEMEEKKDKEEGLFQARSYLGCLNEGLKLPTRHVLSLLKFLWPSLVAGAVSAGLWGLFFNQLSMVATAWLAAAEPVTLLLPAYTLWGLCLLALLAGSFCLGNVAVAISRYAEAGGWPALRFGACRGEIFHASVRALVFLLVGIVVFLVVMAPVYIWAGAHSVWMVVAAAALWLVWGVPYSMVGLDYLLGGRQRAFFQSLARIKDGYQYWGAFFIVLFCGGLIMAVFSLVSWLPAGVLSFAGYESLTGVLAGDATDLPGAVPALIVFFFMLASFVTNMSGWLTFFPLSYLYGSVEARKKDMEKFEEEERRLQNL